jgi:diguanylate cyclase (GGDEF)-like protein
MSADKTIDFKGPLRKKKPREPSIVHCLAVLSGPEQGAIFPLQPGETIVGRCNEHAQIVLTEPGISRTHAKFTSDQNGISVEDMDSTNGVFINGEQTTKASQLKAGDTIDLGGYTNLRISLQDQQVSQLLMNLYQDAILDTSGVLTKKSFDSRIKSGLDSCLAVIELDRLEQIRDRFGHTVGEELTNRVADVLKNGLAEKGIVARLSGEGFIANLNCRALDADNVLEGIRKGIEFSNFKVDVKGGIEFLRVTVSIGIASLVSHDDFEDSLSAAEEALVMAKQMGRNRLHLSERKKFGR